MLADLFNKREDNLKMKENLGHLINLENTNKEMLDYFSRIVKSETGTEDMTLAWHKYKEMHGVED